MEVRFFDIRWPDPSSIELQVHNGQKFGRKQYKKGDTLSFEVKDETVHCVGSEVDGVWQPCGQQSMGRARCEACKARERNFVYTMFDGFNTDMFDADDLAKIAGPHVVYLALFDKDIMKVGVSGLGRKELRQVEQGSFGTLYIAQTENGVQARQIETLLRKTGIQDKIRSSQKKNSIVPFITSQEAEKALRELATPAIEALKEYPKLQPLLLETPEYRNWENEYGIDLLRKEDARLHSVDLLQEDSLSGIIKAIRGPFLVIDTSEEYISLSMKNYIGKSLSFQSKPPGLYTKTAFQNALF